MSDYIDGWECIGCGRVEASRPCVGICQDRRARFVHAEDYEAAVERARVAETALALARRLASTHPRDDHWRESFQAFQSEAQKLMADARDVEEAVAQQSAALM